MYMYYVGVYMSINKTAIANDGYVSSYDMIQNGLPLICHTNKMNCCRDDQLGDWYYPNGTTVDSYTVNAELKHIPEFFSRSRSQSTVSLATGGTYGLRTFLGPPERGRFYCKVPDANDINKTVYGNICEIIAITCFYS